MTFGWLNVFNAELTPKMYWRGPRSQEAGRWEEVGEVRGRLNLTLHCHHQNDSGDGVGGGRRGGEWGWVGRGRGR